MQYISWYKDPRVLGVSLYLCKSEYDQEWYYHSDKKMAFRFDTEKDALAKTPVYDGSDEIEKRTGVIGVE